MECTVKFGSCRQSWARYYKIWNKCLKIEIVYKGENAHMIIPSWLKKSLSSKIKKRYMCYKKKNEWNWIANEPLGLKGICTQM